MPSTPYLVVDTARMRLNIRRTAERAAAAGLAVRPHVKTHKSVEVARLQIAAGASGITVATLGEAEAFATHGIDDIFIAYPVWVDEPRARRLADLDERAVVTIGVDSVESAGQIGRQLGTTRPRVLVEVDSGHHRSGALPADAGRVAASAARAGLDVRGVFTFPGHSYHPAAQESSARDEARALSEASASLRGEGLEVEVVSGGSTPSLAHADPTVLTEVRPGVYVFGDAQQWELGVMAPEEIALTCRATVVSHAGGRMVLDAGSKVLGADRAAYATGFGRVLAMPDARIVLLSEHHAVVDVGPAPLPPLGSLVDVVPNHVCNAVNLADLLHLGDRSPDATWCVTARGHNT